MTSEKIAELHTKALDKLRAKLFSRFKPSDYLIIEDTCKIIDPITYQGETSLGGLSYLLRHPKFEIIRCEVTHFKGSTFSIGIFNESDNNCYTMHATMVDFDNVDKELKRLIAGL